MTNFCNHSLINKAGTTKVLDFITPKAGTLSFLNLFPVSPMTLNVPEGVKKEDDDNGDDDDMVLRSPAT